MSLPTNFQELSYLLDRTFHFQNILIVNTPKTGHFLDTMFLKKKTTRIKYTLNTFDTFINTINSINKTFDLILVDPYHEYLSSIRTFEILIPLLNNNGIFISHGCNPPSFESSSPTYKRGEWCGVTYAAFIEIAYNYPNYYYGVINRDYGLGILSKTEIQFVKKITERDQQKEFLDLFMQNKYKDAYDYFKQYSYNIIHLIN
jgi:hypothetical protein